MIAIAAHPGGRMRDVAARMGITKAPTSELFSTPMGVKVHADSGARSPWRVTLPVFAGRSFPARVSPIARGCRDNAGVWRTEARSRLGLAGACRCDRRAQGVDDRGLSGLADVPWPRQSKRMQPGDCLRSYILPANCGRHARVVRPLPDTGSRHHLTSADSSLGYTHPPLRWRQRSDS